MKSFSALIVTILSLATYGSAFAPAPVFRPKTTTLAAVNGDNPEVVAAVAEVREAAGAFGDETAHFANVWIDKMLEGKQEGAAAGLLDECVLDDNSDNCQRFEKALSKLDSLIGVGAGEQY
mmetsp:Transcript_16101/g.23694  ORF Transcript_16101/g.23694 Transcript_16101/m.23694 type:complete len:121 (-) Transcript_16101:519-881(-)